MKEHTEGDVWLVYNFRGELLVVCDSKDDAEEFIRRKKPDEGNALFYYEKWVVTYYE